MPLLVLLNKNDLPGAAEPEKIVNTLYALTRFRTHLSTSMHTCAQSHSNHYNAIIY